MKHDRLPKCMKAFFIKERIHPGFVEYVFD